MAIKLMMITNNPGIAKEAEDAGVGRIFLDYEILGKEERQGHLDTHITDHEFEDIKLVKNELTESELLVRINPIHENTENEVEKAIDYGADIIMLPMFKTAAEVEQFIDIVDGRVETSLLLETAPAMVRADEICKIDGIDEIHVGLNDLHLSLDLDFMFELLSGGIVEYLADILKGHGYRWGFGGIAKIGEGELPAENILAEHIRLDSDMVILSRTFKGNCNNVNELREEIDLKKEVRKIREKEKEIRDNWTSEDFEENKLFVKSKVQEIVRMLN